MAMFQSPLKTRTCSWSSLRGISLKHLEILTLLSDGSGSFIIVQKKQERMVQVVSVGSLLVLMVVLCWCSNSMAMSKKVGRLRRVFWDKQWENIKEN